MIKNLCIDPTYRCNENCISCRCNSIATQFNNKKMSLDDYYDIINQFVNIGGKSISIYGGEPLLCPFIFEILEYAKSNKLITSITTNGILLKNSKLCKKLIETDIDQITVSIMGVKDVYNIMHGKMYYDTFLAAIKQLILFGDLVKNILSFHVTIQNGNYNQLPEVVKLASELGVVNVSCQYIAMIDSEDNYKTEVILKTIFDNNISHWELSKDLLITKEQINDLYISLATSKKLAEENGINLFIDSLFYSDDAETCLVTGKCKPNGSCELCDLVVLPDGRVGACAMLQHYIIGNVRYDSLVEIINSSKFKELQKKVENGFFLPVCSGCCRHDMFFC